MAKKTRKPYRPIAPYTELARVQALIADAQTKEDLTSVMRSDGPKVGYKAFCYMATAKMTAEQMKPDEVPE